MEDFACGTYKTYALYLRTVQDAADKHPWSASMKSASLPVVFSS